MIQSYLLAHSVFLLFHKLMTHLGYHPHLYHVPHRVFLKLRRRQKHFSLVSLSTAKVHCYPQKQTLPKRNCRKARNIQDIQKQQLSLHSMSF